MNKLLFLLAFLTIFSLGVVSAIANTSVHGTVYDAQNATVSGANVTVFCNNDQFEQTIGVGSGNYMIASTVSDGNGNYDVSLGTYDTAPDPCIVFVGSPGQTCGYGDLVAVYVSKDGVNGTSSGSIDTKNIESPLRINTCDLSSQLDVQINSDAGSIPTVPEFSIFIGISTVIGALVALMLIRKN